MKDKYPKPQGYLSKKGKFFYDQICKHLEGAEYLMEVDSFGLSMMAQCLQDFHEASDETNRSGTWQTSENGYTQKSGPYTIKNDCYNTFYKLSGLFGMSPKAREALVRFKNMKTEEDAFDKV